MRLALVALVPVLSTAAAQVSPSTTSKGSTSTTGTATSSAAIRTHTVKVGDDNFMFVPNSTVAAVGDVIEWQFYPANHSVVEAAYGYPCVPLDYTDPDTPTFYSGIHDEGNETPFPVPTYRVRVNDTEPHFYYCSTPGSCNVKGMVGVINPNSGVSLAHQQALALQAPFALSPGENAPSENPTSTSSSTTASATSTSSTSLPTTMTTPTPTPTPSKSLSKGAIAGIAVGAVAALAVLGALFFYIGRNHRYKEILRSRSSNVPNDTYPGAPPYPGGPVGEMSAFSTPHPGNNDWKYAAADQRTLSSSLSPPLPSPGFPQASYFNQHGPPIQEAETSVRAGSPRSTLDAEPYSSMQVVDPVELRQATTHVSRFHELETPFMETPLYTREIEGIMRGVELGDAERRNVIS